MQLPIHSYRLRSTPASSARIVNCYPEKLPDDAKTPFILTRASGIRPHATPGTGPIRGIIEFLGDVFAVSGTSLYKVDAAGTETLIGSIPGSGTVSMDQNTQYLVIVAEPNAYYTDGSTVTQITDTDFTSRGAKYVKFCDNFMIFTEPGTGRFFWAAVGTVTDFDALDFVTAEGNPDATIGIAVDHQQVLPFGTKSIELWKSTDSGFERLINGFIEKGCINGDTIAKQDNSLFWVGHDYGVWRLTGSVPVRVSQHAVEQFLSTVDTSTLRAFAYDQDGHFFYVICCSTGCFVYDVTTGEWHERETYGQDYFRWQFQCLAHGRQYVGDYYSNEIGYFDPTWYKDGSDIQRMAWTYQPVYAKNKMARHNRIEVVMETGVGLTTGQGSDPQMMMSISNDGGKTATNLPTRDIGEIGEYTDRVWWDKLGAARQRVYSGAISDPIKVVISDTVLDVVGARV